MGGGSVGKLAVGLLSVAAAAAMAGMLPAATAGPRQVDFVNDDTSTLNVLHAPSTSCADRRGH